MEDLLSILLVAAFGSFFGGIAAGAVWVKLREKVNLNELPKARESLKPQSRKGRVVIRSDEVLARQEKANA